MADTKGLVGTWVEIGERSGGGEIVFYRLGSDVPPARGRRQLRLEDEGLARGAVPGATDKTESAGSGDWSLDGKTLHIALQGWEGDYEVKSAREDELILRKR